MAVVLSYGPNGFGAYTVSGTRNTLPGSTTDEYQNTNAGGGTTYFRRTQTTDDAATGGAFDDYVMFLTADDLLGPLFKDGTLSRLAWRSLRDTFTMIENAIAQLRRSDTARSYGGSTCTSSGSYPRCHVIPYVDYYNGNGALNCAACYDGGVPWHRSLGLPASAVLDPWGRPIRYQILTSTRGSISGIQGGGISSTQPPGGASAYSLTSFGPDRSPGGNFRRHHRSPSLSLTCATG